MPSISWGFRVRRRIIAAVVLLSTAGFTGGCAVPAAPTPEGSSEASVRVRHGESVAVASGALEVSFDSVASDSRCPKGETCAWEGDGIVFLSVREPGRPPVRLELHTSARGPSDAGYEVWSIRLVALEPFPVTGRTIAAAEYVATLSVSRLGEGGPATQ